MCKENKKFNELRLFIEKTKNYDEPKSHLINVLHKAQDLYGYLDKDIMYKISLLMEIPASQIWGVATFYHYFKLKPQGEHTISLCMGTACYVKGAAEILETIKKELNIEVGETTEDNLFTICEARCIGSCGLAPVAMIDDKVFGDLNSEKIKNIINDYRKKNKKN